MRVLTVTDSDSYLKWAVALLAGAPSEWGVRHLVLENVIAPSPDQVQAARSGTPRGPVGRVGGVGLIRRVRQLAPDVLVVACTGPAVDAVMELLHRGGVLTGNRPALVTGLPGISYPANDLAVLHRRGFDLMVLHSRRERAAYADVADRLGGPQMVLATLPYLASVRAVPPGGDEVIFAAQSLVPPRRQDREAILTALAGLPAGLRPVVKVRALSGERQAHNEALPYAALWAEMPQPPPVESQPVESPPVESRPVEFRAGAMADALVQAAGFVTVSSTAVLEALAAGVPALVLDEFGVSGELINAVFADSGLLGGLDRLRAGDFASPRPEWLADNYFHPTAENDWALRVGELAARRRVEPLPAYAGQPVGSRLERARRQLRILPPAGVWRVMERFTSRTGKYP